MEDRFGSAPVGVAGENIVIEGPALSLGDLGEGMGVENGAGDLISLERPRVAAPCV